MIRQNALLLVCLILSSSAFAQSSDEKPDFKGVACTKDCSGHRAGYDWAQTKGITEKIGCRGRSKSFVEGCLIYVTEMQAKNKKSMP